MSDQTTDYQKMMEEMCTPRPRQLESGPTEARELAAGAAKLLETYRGTPDALLEEVAHLMLKRAKTLLGGG